VFGLDFGKLGSVGGRRSLYGKVASLFAQGQAGAWYDPGDLATLYQDTAGALAVTAAGQPVGRMLDKSGRGNHMVQATAAARALVQADGSLLLDGIDDSLISPTGAGATTGFFFCGAVKPTTLQIAHIFSDFNSNTMGYLVQLTAAGIVRFNAGNGSAVILINTTTAAQAGVVCLLTAWDDGAALNVQINNGVVSSVARPAVVAGTAGFTLGKSNGALANFFPGNIYPFIYRSGTPMTPAEIAVAQAWCRGRAGL
jgi:hypothetical protein